MLIGKHLIIVNQLTFVFPLVIYNIAVDFDLDFFALYSCTGLWNSFFLFVYSTFGLSQIMKWSTRYNVSSIYISFIFLRFKKSRLSLCNFPYLLLESVLQKKVTVYNHAIHCEFLEILYHEFLFWLTFDNMF